MTEAASTTSFPAVDPLLPQTAFRTLSQANVHFDDKTPDGSSFHGEYHSKTSQPPTAKALFNGDLLPLRALCAKLHSQITAFLDEKVQNVRLQAAQAQTRRSLQIIQEALDRYPLSALSLSYNGGKDCLVLLILYLSLLSNHPCLPRLLPAIYIPTRYPFLAVESFVASSSAGYHLELARHAHPSMREAFTDYLAANRNIRAIFVGTRRTDPHGGKLSPLEPTDGGWPAFMRVHPVIEWKYAEIWSFLRHLNIPYCELYDQGYTSLGGTTDTHPNPALRVTEAAGRGEEEADQEREEKVENADKQAGANGVAAGHADLDKLACTTKTRPQTKVYYKPAYELEDDASERLGRDR